MSLISTIIQPRERDLGGFTVRRILPATGRQMVGPFIFLDHMGPARFPAGQGVDVRPHPHIGLATVTWLFDGALLHRDSLGAVQEIQPGAVNWMTAGRGIVHSERTPPALRRQAVTLHGMQSWIALPRDREDMDPAFHHFEAGEIPDWQQDHNRIQLIAGRLFGQTSPVPVHSAMGYAAVTAAPGSRLTLDPEHGERGIYVVEGGITIGDEGVEAGCLAVLAPGQSVPVAAAVSSRFMVLAGAPADGPRHIWWNFVASSEARIDAAARRWETGGFPPVPGETGFIPLPAR